MDFFHMYLPFVNQQFNVLLLLGLGFAVGVLAGFFGMGGGWVVAPALYSLGFPMHYAIGTGLANITAQSALATVKHRKMGNVDYTLGIATGLPMMGGVELGKRLVAWLAAQGLSGAVIGWVYVALLVSLAAFVIHDYLAERKNSKDGQEELETEDTRPALLRIPPVIRLKSCDVEVSFWALLALGLFIGFLAGMLGSGGGFALVPAFVYLVGTPTMIAVGTSLVCVMISGSYGAFTYGLNGFVELTAALWLVGGAIVGAQLGAAATTHVRGYGIRLLYAVMLLFASTGLVLKQLAVMPNAEGDSRIAPVIILGGALFMCALIIGNMVISWLAKRRPV